MANVNKAVDEVADLITSLSDKDLMTQEEYRSFLEAVYSDVDSRLSAVEEELAAQEEDDSDDYADDLDDDE